MTTEATQFNSELNPSYATGRDFMHELTRQPGVKSAELVAGDPYLIDPSQEPVEHTVNDTTGVSQQLKAIVSASSYEQFGVVKVGLKGADVQGESSHWVITRFSQDPQQRGQIVGILEPGVSMLVGREMLEEAGTKGVNDHMSRKHFSVVLTPEGQVAINDEHSTNGTKVITTDRHIHDHPRAGFGVWAPPTAEVRDTLDSHVSDSTVQKSETEKQIDELDQRIKQIKESVSEEDGMNLWRYATGSMQKSDAQHHGDGEGSIYWGQQSGQAYRALSEPAARRADEYLHLMQAKHKLLLAEE